MPINNNVQLPVGIAIRRGMLAGFDGIHKFGYNPSVGSSFETIWDAGNGYTYPSTATTATATSSNTAADNGSTVEVQGLDENYDLAVETITVGGGASTTTFIRVFRAVLKTANTGDVNVGTIQITVDSTTVAQIAAGYGQTLMAIYTIPRNHTGFILQLDIGGAKDLETEIQLLTKEVDNGNVWNTKSYITTRGGFMEKNYIIPINLPGKTDIELRAKASATGAVSGGFEIILQKNL